MSVINLLSFYTCITSNWDVALEEYYIKLNKRGARNMACPEENEREPGSKSQNTAGDRALSGEYTWHR